MVVRVWGSKWAGSTPWELVSQALIGMVGLYRIVLYLVLFEGRNEAGIRVIELEEKLRDRV